MAQSTSKRQAVVSSDLAAILGKYMLFRHVFRHAYDFELKWRKMSDLVLQTKQVLDRLEAELMDFFDSERQE